MAFLFKHNPLPRIVSQLKYVAHAVRLSASQDAPIYRAPSRIDDVNTHGTYEYEHANSAK